MSGFIFNLQDIVRPNIWELTPYRCARDDYSSGILLDANENSLGSPAATVLTHDSLFASLELNRYPDPLHLSLKQQIGAYRGGIPAEKMFLGVGSDEAIDLLIRICCAPKEHAILITPPTYGMYKVCAKVNDVSIQTVNLNEDFTLDAEALLAGMRANTRLVFLCSPGNPTARQLPLAQLRYVAEQMLVRGVQALLVVDEAYVDFCVDSDNSDTNNNNSTDNSIGADNVQSSYPIASSATSLVIGDNVLPNVVVLQTLSKAFGLAGIRLGLAVASPQLIQVMNNVKAPYNVNLLTARTAHAVFSSPTSVSQIRNNIHTLLEQRVWLSNQLETVFSPSLVTRVFHSDANFILFRVKDQAEKLYKLMADEHNVVCRFRGHEVHCDQCLRVTVGSAEENVAFLAALRAAATKLGLL